MEQFFQDIGQIAAQPYIAVIVVTALLFDFVNGFHDAANSIATIVGTRVMKPFTAVVWAAFWNFAAMWVFGFAVANTVAKWVHIEFVNPDVIFAGLIGAIIWNLITWVGGLPSSSSHALLGGICGAAIAHAGKFGGVLNNASVLKTVEFIVLAPLIGFVIGYALMLSMLWLCRGIHARTMDRASRYLQIVTAAGYSLGHGTNDSQKTIGIISALLFSTVWKNEQANIHHHEWIAVACFSIIGLGTMAGGWRIIRTMGMKIAKLRAHSGAMASGAGAITLFLSTHFGIPVSTTHTITGAIMGVGCVERISAVRWGIARSVIWAWVLTIPASAIMGALCVKIIPLLHH
jgi:PiT family inorganic phosphate transporter